MTFSYLADSLKVHKFVVKILLYTHYRYCLYSQHFYSSHSKQDIYLLLHPEKYMLFTVVNVTFQYPHSQIIKQNLKIERLLGSEW
jgi:hypothetical protein